MPTLQMSRLWSCCYCTMWRASKQQLLLQRALAGFGQIARHSPLSSIATRRSGILSRAAYGGTLYSIYGVPGGDGRTGPPSVRRLEARVRMPFAPRHVATRSAIRQSTSLSAVPPCSGTAHRGPPRSPSHARFWPVCRTTWTAWREGTDGLGDCQHLLIRYLRAVVGKQRFHTVAAWWSAARTVVRAAPHDGTQSGAGRRRDGLLDCSRPSGRARP